MQNIIHPRCHINFCISFGSEWNGFYFWNRTNGALCKIIFKPHDMGHPIVGKYFWEFALHDQTVDCFRSKPDVLAICKVEWLVAERVCNDRILRNAFENLRLSKDPRHFRMCIQTCKLLAIGLQELARNNHTYQNQENTLVLPS